MGMVKLVGEEQPVICPFEPDYLTTGAQRRNLLLYRFEALDTLTISDRKRKKLIRGLNRDLNSDQFTEITEDKSPSKRQAPKQNVL